MSRISDIIGNTPLVEFTKLSANPEVKIFGKLEGTNPGGSVKDRAALYMIQGALQRNELKPGIKLIEATSGNTGISLAMIAGLYGIEIELVLPENSTLERILAMKAYGAKVTLTPREKSMEGAIDYVQHKIRQGGYVLLDQFSNPDNPRAHYFGTGPEIWEATNGQVTHFISAMGTTGTIMGVSKYLKEQSKKVRIVGVQPSTNANIPGIRFWPKKYLPAIYDSSRVDRIITVSAEQATEMTRMLAKTEGVLAGMSSGGAVYAAVQLSKELKKGLIVCIICDRGDRYLNSGLFE